MKNGNTLKPQYHYHCYFVWWNGINQFCSFYIFGVTILHLKNLKTLKGINMLDLRF